MRAVVTGATGFIGSRLLEHLEGPVVLTRDPHRAAATLASRRATPVQWDPQHAAPPPEVLEGVEAVFHLAGESVGTGRWTAAKKQRIRDSRVLGTRHLIDALRRLQQPPRVFVCASAVGYYGSRGEELLNEQSPPGDDFLAEVCREWERAAAGAEQYGIRTVSLRSGVVLGRGGGALARMLTPFRFGMGGRLGSGRQWMPWVHRDDLVALLLHAARTPQIRGPVNGVAPNPVTNREFTRTLASVLRRPALLPVPGFMLRLAVGEFADVLLASQRVVPEVARQTGFEFCYPELRAALEAILNRNGSDGGP